jgi:putative transposase
MNDYSHENRLSPRELAAEGYKIGRRHVKTLMRRMGIERSSPPPHSPSRGHKGLSALLRGVEITRRIKCGPSPMTRGFVYLAVVLDNASHRVPVVTVVDQGGDTLYRDA